MTRTRHRTDLVVDSALIERLASLPSYSRLPRRSLSDLVAAGVSRALRSGERILTEGATSGSIFVLLSGRLKMTRSLANGRNVLLAIFSPGDSVGLAALGDRPSDATVTALESSLCLAISRSELLAAMTASPSLVGELLPIFTERVAECRNCVMEGTFFRIAPRLARLFLKLGEAIGRPAAGAVFLPVPLSRQDLADMAGTTLETSIRILSRWGKEGIVETREDGFLLRDRQALAAICEE